MIDKYNLALGSSVIEAFLVKSKQGVAVENAEICPSNHPPVSTPRALD